jgi:MoaA/NifB/PqqE/SkfB family radical SAM enzyme
VRQASGLKRYVLRAEGFGGLLYDRKSLEIKALDKKEFERMKDSGKDVEVKAGKIKDNLSTLMVPTKLYLVLTRRCNLGCLHCSNDSGSQRSEQMDYSLVKDILAQARRIGVFEIALNGGEPTCHPDFFRIVDCAKRMGFPLYLNTNGIYSQDVLNRLAHSRIDRIKVSIDGLEESHDNIRGKGMFRKAVESIRYLKRNKNDVRINYSICEANKKDALAMVKLANELRCGIKIAPIIPVGRAHALGRNRISAEDAKGISKKIAEYCREKAIKVSIEMAAELVSDDCKSIADSFSYQVSRCGKGIFHMTIDTDCEAYNTGRQTDIDGLSPLGNIKDQPLMNLWQEGRTRNEKARASDSVCRDCNMEQQLIKSFSMRPKLDWWEKT